MRDNTQEIQINHKEEAPARIKADREDRLNLRQKLSICIDPLNPDEHPSSCLINIVTEEIILNNDVITDDALELGIRQQKDFEAAFPDGFYKSLKKVTVSMNASRKSINIGDQKIVDTGVFYAHALSLHASQRDGSPSIELMLATELSPVATSMFDDHGNMTATQKSHLKNYLAIERSHKGIIKDSYFLDGCAVLWVVPWPASSNALVQDYIDSFRTHIYHYQHSADIYLIFERYTSSSIKEVI